MCVIGAINKKTNEYTHPNQAKKGDKFQCFDCLKDVIVKKGDKRIHHFAHCKKENCEIFEKPDIEQTHKNAQYTLKYILENKIPLVIKYKQCSECKTEFEPFPIPEITENSSIVVEHRFQYNGLKIADVTYIENENEIKYIFEIFHTHKTKPEDRPEPWFEFDAKTLNETYDEYLMNATPDGVIYLQCICETICEDCDLKEKNKKGIIYFNQRGAGCGKTYESIQLVQPNNTDERFVEKDTFIYLTKMHSAKDVIYTELKDQKRDGMLNDLEMVECDDGHGKQYKMSYLNKRTNKKISIVIGTIDSFNYAVVDKDRIIPQNDYFKGIVKSIQKGHIVSSKDNKIYYAGKKHLLNKNCLIIIDEAQDLGKEYIEAFKTIISQTNIDIFVIGDKLQSIWGESNIHTYIDKTNLENIYIERHSGINKVRRFHNTQFIKFVNDVIPFAKYELPEITEICDDDTKPCSCKYGHKNDVVPYNLFEVPTIYSNELNYSKIDEVIETILTYMEKEIIEYNYLPNNFMFIFPILSHNTFSTMLETRLQKFWIDKFNDIEYQDRAGLNMHKYWENKINDNKFYKYVYLHKSDEGKSINLNESKNSSRILSIHSSKGNGCEVVFVLGITEQSLSICSKKSYTQNELNLTYDSLLHVAITRQKKSIYIGIENNGDDIYKRFEQFEINKNIIFTDLIGVSKYLKSSKIKQFICENEETFEKINNAIIKPNDCIKWLPKKELLNPTEIIDWGHHTVRFAVFVYYIQFHIQMDTNNDSGSIQFITKLRQIPNKKIILCDYKTYNKQLRIIDKCNRDRNAGKDTKMTDELPLLCFNETNQNTKYFKYTKILQKIIKQIQVKLNRKYNELPKLCPIECVVLLFMIRMFDNGSYSDLPIMDVYSVIYCYDSCSDAIDEEHTKTNECICKNCFENKDINYDDNKEQDKTNENKVRESIVNHFEIINSIKQMYFNYNNITNEMQIKNIKYNIFHTASIGKDQDEFVIRDEFNIIGHSQTHVIYFMIKPQFNELNFNEIMCDAIINHFIISNVKESNNFERYNGKKIITCIFTFDSNTPIFCEFDIKNNKVLIKQIINDVLIQTHVKNHERVYNFYKFCDKTKPEKLNGFKHTLDCLNQNIYKNIPNYITGLFKDIIKDSMSTKAKIMQKENKNKKNMCENLNTRLVESVDLFLYMIDDDDDDDDNDNDN